MDSPTDFLISILADDKDELNSSMAILELSSLCNVYDIIRLNQDAANPLLRRRIQQLSVFLNRKNAAKSMLSMLEDDACTHWDVCACINVILEPRASFTQLNELAAEFVGHPAYRIRNSRVFVQMLNSIGMAADTNRGSILAYMLLQDVMLNNIGHPLTVAVIAQKFGRLCGWNTTLGLYKGFPCLRDARFQVLVPEKKWEALHPPVADFLPISKRQLAVTLLSEILASAFLDQFAAAYSEAKDLLEKILAG